MAIEPKVGTLKLVASSSIKSNSSISYKSSSFDGWMYPDGKTTLSLSDFVLSNDLNALYGLGDGKTFKLPEAKGFLTPNGKISIVSGSAISREDAHNVLVKH